MLRCEALRADAPSWRPAGIEGAIKALAIPAPAKTHSERTFMPHKIGTQSCVLCVLAPGTRFTHIPPPLPASHTTKDPFASALLHRVW